MNLVLETSLSGSGDSSGDGSGGNLIKCNNLPMKGWKPMRSVVQESREHIIWLRTLLSFNETQNCPPEA